MNTQHPKPLAEVRYRLTLYGYPDELAIPSACKLVYGSADKNLIATISNPPYTVGKTFDVAEAESIHKELQRLEIAHRLSDTAGVQAPLEFNVPSSEKQSSDAAAVLNLKAVHSKKETAKVVTPSGTPQKPTGFIQRKGKRLAVATIFSILVAAGAYTSWVKRKPSNSSTTSTATSATKETILGDDQALLETFTKEVETRRAKEVVWNKAEPQMILNQMDAIRTFAQSEASIRYAEGTRVQVRENTLMIVGQSENDTPSNREIQLEDGSIDTRLKASSEPRKFSIRTSSGVLELTTPPPGSKGDTQVQTSLKGGELQVAVTEGKVLLRPAQKDAAPVEIGSMQKLVATKDSVSAPISLVPKIFVIAPSNEMRLQFDPSKTSTTLVTFQWNEVREPNDRETPYHVLIGSDPALQTILLDQETPSLELKLNYLDIGTLYWKVRTVIQGTLFESEVRRLYVEKKSQH